MSQKQLEDATLRHYRFMAKLISFPSGESLESVQKWNLPQLTFDLPDSILLRFNDAWLVLGGRFLFTVCAGLGRFVTLWDLDPQLRTPSERTAIPDMKQGRAEPLEIASLSPDDLGLDTFERVKLKDCVIAPDGKHLYLEVFTGKPVYHTSSSTSIIQRSQIWSIDPLQEGPVFTLIATRETRGAYDSSYDGKYLVFLEETLVTVWNYHTDESVSWPVEDSARKTLAALDGFIFVIDVVTGDFDVWEIPSTSLFATGRNLIDLQPSESSTLTKPSQDRPIIDIGLALPKGPTLANSLTCLTQPKDMEEGDNAPTTEIFSVFMVKPGLGEGSMPNKPQPTVRHHCSIEVEIGTRLLSTFLPMAGGFFILPTYCSRGRPMNARIDLHVADHSQPQTGGERSVKQNVVRLAQASQSTIWLDLCPVSARIVTVSTKGEVQIAQYIA